LSFGITIVDVSQKIVFRVSEIICLFFTSNDSLFFENASAKQAKLDIKSISSIISLCFEASILSVLGVIIFLILFFTTAQTAL
jgi:hypothetical protein